MTYWIPYIFVFAYCIFAIQSVNDDLVYVASQRDQQMYQVREGLLKQDKAELLSEIKARLTKLVHYLKENEAKYPSMVHTIRLLSQRFPLTKLSEGIVDPGYTSYTLGKQYIYMCLESRDGLQKLYGINLVMYVALHELGHIASVSSHHTDEFKSVFSFLVERALELGIYVYEDYAKNNVEYCGITLKNTIV